MLDHLRRERPRSAFALAFLARGVVLALAQSGARSTVVQAQGLTPHLGEAYD